MISKFSAHTVWPDASEDPYEYLWSIEGWITDFLDEQLNEERTVANIELTYLRLDELEELGGDSFELFDTSRALLEIGSDLYRRNEMGELILQDNIASYLKENGITKPFLDLLVIRYIEVIAAYRGRGLATKLIAESTKLFGQGCDLIALVPSPISPKDLKLESSPDLHAPANDRADLPSLHNLMNIYGKMGFVRSEGRTMVCTPLNSDQRDRTQLSGAMCSKRTLSFSC